MNSRHRCRRCHDYFPAEEMNGPFCSAECAAGYRMSRQRRQAIRQNTRVRSLGKPAVRQTVAARDGYQCLLCSSRHRGLHLHRVVYGSAGGKYQPDNCVLLCATHHMLVHSDKKTWSKPLLEHLSGKPIQVTMVAP